MNFNRLTFKNEKPPTMFADRYKELLLQIKPRKDRLVFVSEGYSILPCDLIHEEWVLNSEDGIHVSSSFTKNNILVTGLNEAGLQLSHWVPNQSLQPISNHAEMSFSVFQLRLLKLFLSICEDALAQVFTYLQHRKAEKKLLTQLSVIQCDLARVELKCQQIHALLESDQKYSLVLEELSDVALMLIKLLGGRSLLSGNLIELKWVLELFAMIYFKGMLL